MVTTEILKVEGEFVRCKNLLDRVFYHEKEILVILKIRRNEQKVKIIMMQLLECLVLKIIKLMPKLVVNEIVKF